MLLLPHEVAHRWGGNQRLDLYWVVSFRLVAAAQPAVVERLLQSGADGEQHPRSWPVDFAAPPSARSSRWGVAASPCTCAERW